MGQYQEQHGKIVFYLCTNDHNTAQFFAPSCTDNIHFLRLKIWKLWRCSCMEFRSQSLNLLQTIWNTTLTFGRSQSVYTGGMTATYSKFTEFFIRGIALLMKNQAVTYGLRSGGQRTTLRVVLVRWLSVSYCAVYWLITFIAGVWTDNGACWGKHCTRTQARRGVAYQSRLTLFNL